MFIAAFGCLAGLFVVGFTYLDVLRKNKYLEKENKILNNQVWLLTEQVIKQEDDLSEYNLLKSYGDIQ
jgi:hypothetical protein